MPKKKGVYVNNRELQNTYIKQECANNKRDALAVTNFLVVYAICFDDIVQANLPLALRVLKVRVVRESAGQISLDHLIISAISAQKISVLVF
jgi:hypothetical protein